MYFKYWQSAITFLALLMVVGSFLVTWPTGKTYADPPPFLDLEIDSPGTIRWDMSNIKPGDSGLEPVTLRNTGNATGYLCIWISDLVDDEGVNPESETGNTTNPGELSTYLYLDIINNGMTFGRLIEYGRLNMALPVSLRYFPADMNHALCITSTALEVGQALELQWQWSLSPGTRNDAQGDTASFSLNYSLIYELPPLFIEPRGSGGGKKTEEPEEPEETEEITPEPTPETPPTSTPAADDNKIPETEPTIEARIFISEDGRCFIYIPRGLRVMTDSGQELLDIVIDSPDDIPSIPESFSMVSPVYRFYCKTPDGITDGTQLTHDVQLTIYFDPDKIPENAVVSIFRYHPGSGWTKLDCQGDPSRGWLSARIDYLDTVAVLAVSEESMDVITGPAAPYMPDTEATSFTSAALRQVSLGVAVSGTIAMTVLAGIQRRRRNAMKRNIAGEPVDT